MSNYFFKNNGPVKISTIHELLNIKQNQLDNDQDVLDIKDLFSSKKEEITFFHSKKYKDIAKNTKASFCITTEFLKEDLPKNCKPILVDNVLLATSKITAKFYPNSINDHFDHTAVVINNTKFKDKAKYGLNVLIGKNVEI